MRRAEGSNYDGPRKTGGCVQPHTRRAPKRTQERCQPFQPPARAPAHVRTQMCLQTTGGVHARPTAKEQHTSRTDSTHASATWSRNSRTAALQVAAAKHSCGDGPAPGSDGSSAPAPDTRPGSFPRRGCSRAAAAAACFLVAARAAALRRCRRSCVRRLSSSAVSSWR